jgi:hypothetical protein
VIWHYVSEYLVSHDLRLQDGPHLPFSLDISALENEDIALSQNIRNQIFGDPSLYPKRNGNSGYILNIIEIRKL